MECCSMIANSFVPILTIIIRKRCSIQMIVLVLLLLLNLSIVSNSFTITKTTITISTSKNDNINRYNKNRFGRIETVPTTKTISLSLISIRKNNLQKWKPSSNLQLGVFVDVDILTTTATAITTTTSSSSSILLSNSFTDFEYTLQNLANNLASISLDNTGSSSSSIGTGSGSTSVGPTNILLSLPIMYGAGLLTSASPCVWGLLPLTMSYISQAAGERTDKQTTIPTIAFAAGLASVFCTLGVVAVQLGGVFGSTTSAATTVSSSIFNINNDESTTSISSSLILALVSNTICFAMGLQLLDFITIRFPSISRDSIRTFFSGGNTNSNSATTTTTMNGQSLILIDATGRIMTQETVDDDTTAATKGSEFGSLVRTFLLGGSSALVASPCATPVLTSILGYVSSTSNPLLGGLLLLGYTLGYSTPLLIVAATGGQALESLRSATSSGGNNGYALIGPWVTPITGGILLFYGTNGILYTIFGDPSIAGLAIL